MRVTAIERQPRGRRAAVFIDGRPALTLSLDVVTQSGLRVGDGLDEAGLDSLRQAEARHGALAAALRLLSYRPRSEAELRQRLARRGSTDAIIGDTLKRLRDLALVDDDAFARTWVDSRDQTSPRGRRLLAHELRSKGVDRQIVREALGAVNEADAAYRAGSRRARSLQGLPFPQFQRRLGGFLLRRGFGPEMVRQTVGRLWLERGDPPTGGE